MVTGSYTTSNIPPGQPGYVTPSTTNPSGWAKFNETSDDSTSVTGTVSLMEVASATNGGWTLSYSGTAQSNVTSNRTVTFDAVQNVNTDTGSYNMTGGKWESSKVAGQGSGGGGGFGISWTINASIGAFVSYALTPVLGQLAQALIPGNVITSFLNAISYDAIMIGGSVGVNFPLGSLSAGFNVTGGIEVLASPHTGGAAVFTYLGGGLNAQKTNLSVGLSAYLGFVLQSPRSSNYFDCPRYRR